MICMLGTYMYNEHFKNIQNSLFNIFILFYKNILQYWVVEI